MTHYLTHAPDSRLVPPCWVVATHPTRDRVRVLRYWRQVVARRESRLAALMANLLWDIGRPAADRLNSVFAQVCATGKLP